MHLLVEGMPRSGCQLGVRDPQSLLLLPLLARPHRHTAILRTMSVDTSDVFAYESRLAPRAAKQSWLRAGQVSIGRKQGLSNGHACPNWGAAQVRKINNSTSR